jgi:uncharacterized protein (TIGR02594 family)
MKDQLNRKRLLDAAFKYLGTKEVSGPGSNPLIIEWFENWGAGWQKDDSKLAWCAIFINQVLKEAGLIFSGKLNAKSFLKEGEPTDNPKPGDIVIYWRSSPDSWKGHVGIYIREDERYIWTLGGNQNNEVNITKYAKSRLLGFRTPIKAG